MGLPPGGMLAGEENVSTTETKTTNTTTRQRKFSCLRKARPLPLLRDEKKVSADRKSLVKGSLEALLNSFDDDDDSENGGIDDFLNRKTTKGGGKGGLRRCHSGGEILSMGGKMSGMKMPTRLSASNMNIPMKRKSDPVVKGKIDSMKNSTFKNMMPSSLSSAASNIMIPIKRKSEQDKEEPDDKEKSRQTSSDQRAAVSKSPSSPGILSAMQSAIRGGGGEQQQQQQPQQQQQKLHDDPFVDYLLYMESQKQSQEEYDNMFKRSPGTMIKKIVSKKGVGSRIANMKRSSSDGGDNSVNANERRKSLTPRTPTLTNLSDHFKLKRSKSDQGDNDADARSFFSTLSGRKERTVANTSGGDKSVSSERLNRRSLDLSLFSSTLSGRAERSVCVEGPQYQCLDDSKEGFVDEQQQEDKIDDDDSGGFKTPTTQRRRSIEHNDEDWLGEESTMPLVDNSSEEFRTPTTTTSRQGLSPHSRRKSRSPSAGRSATTTATSSTIDDSIEEEEEEGPQSTGTSSDVEQQPPPPPPPPQSPISLVDDDDWGSVDLEGPDYGTASPSSLSSHKRSSSRQQRSRSVGADPTEGEYSSTTKSPGGNSTKERRNKSHSPGKHRKKDRKTTDCSRNSPGKNKDRKSSTVSPGKHKDGRMSSGSSNTSSIIIPPRDICFMNTPAEETTTEAQSVFDDLSTNDQVWEDDSGEGVLELPQTSPGTLTERKIKKDSKKSKSPKQSRTSKKSTKKKKKRDKSPKKGDNEDINKKKVDVMCDDFFGDYVAATSATSPMASPSKNGSLRRHSFDSLRDFAGDNNIDYSAHCNMMMIDRSVHDADDDRERKTRNDSSGDTKSKNKDRKSSKKRSSKKSSTSSKKSVKKNSKGDLSKASSKEVTLKKSSGEAALGVLDGAFDDVSNDKSLESPTTTNRSNNGSFRRHSFDDSIRDISVLASPRQQQFQTDAALAAVDDDDENDENESDIESSTVNDEDEDEFALGDETINCMPPPTRKTMMLSHKGNKKRSITEDSFRGLSTF